jgi:PmbA protein
MIDLHERVEKALVLSEDYSDKTEIFASTNNLLSIRIANNKVIESKAISDSGIGIRVLKNTGLGFSSTTDLTDNGLLRTVNDASVMAKYRETGFNYDFPYPKKVAKAPTFDEKTSRMLSDPETVTELAHTMMDSSMDTSKKVVENSGIINILQTTKHILSTNEIDVTEETTGWSAFLTSTAQEGHEQREGMTTGSTIRINDFKPEKIGKESAEMAVKSLGGKKIQEKEYELILLPSASQCIVTELAGCTNPPTMESSIPLLQDRLGERIGSEQLTIRMNPRRTGFALTGTYDDEGVPAKELTLFENGVFTASPYDSWYAQRNEVESTGHGFRAMSMFAGGTVYHGKMYHSEPSPRTACLEMAKGQDSLDDMVSSTKDGIMVGVVWYSRIMLPTRGDYNAIMRMGTMKVENGEVVGAVKKFRLVDNILDLAKNIEMVGTPQALSHWHMPYGRMAPIKISKAMCMPYHD